MLQSIYEPLNFLGPLVIKGKLMIRFINEKYDWDDTMDPVHSTKWNNWKYSILSLQELTIPMMYIFQSVNKDTNFELHVFSDASQQAIAAVGYIKQDSEESSFVFCKSEIGRYSWTHSTKH
jgi:hypothetical protein